MSGSRSRIQQEIRQTRPFRSRRQECLIALLRTADVVTRRLAAVVEPHGVTLQQYNVLRILRGAGVDGLPTLEIAERMIERAPGITRLLDRLERKRLVLRRRCGRDRRRILCSIAPAGLELLGSMEAPMAAADESWAGRLRSGDVGTLVRMLDAVRGSAGAARKTRGTRQEPGGSVLN